MTRRAKASGLALCLIISCATLAPAAEYHVQMVGISFNPPLLQIALGDKVTWTNNSSFQHSVTSGQGCVANGFFDSGLLGPSGQWSHTFNADGSFPYFCVPHCAFGMVGEIYVSSAVPVEGLTWGAIKDLYKIE